MTQVKVKVLRPLRGDKLYARGDTRMLSKEDADRLAATGAVEIVKAAKKPAVRKAAPKKPAAKVSTVKKATAPKNKMAAKPANKAAK